MLTDYHEYRFSTREWILYLAEYLVAVAFIAALFYDSVIALVLLLVGLKRYYGIRRAGCIRRRKSALTLEFREFLGKLSVNLQCGYSLENAMRESLNDLELICGTQSLLAGEIRRFLREMMNHVPVEQLWEELGHRSGISVMEDFAAVIRVARESGGNLPAVIGRSSERIGESLDLKRDLETAIASKKFEAGIMAVIPFFMIGYINVTSPGYFEVLYHNVTGIAISTVCLTIYAIALYLILKIVNIQT